jgi:hypothetical protein
MSGIGNSSFIWLCRAIGRKDPSNGERSGAKEACSRGSLRWNLPHLMFDTALSARQGGAVLT